MKNYINVLKKCPLFFGIQEGDIVPLLSCLGATVKEYCKGETVLSEGQKITKVGVVLSGKVQLLRVDYNGNRSIVANIAPSELFSEAFACAEAPLPLWAVANEVTQIMFIDSHRLTKSCSNACDFHSKIVFNLLKIMATKNIGLNRKAEIISKRSTRAKLMAYLTLIAQNTGSKSFTIPFDRQELADYLEVDRSGLSAEIGKLQREGVLKSHRSQFTLNI